MIRSASHLLAVVLVVALTALAAAGCRRGPRPQPGDPMLDAIRAKERGGDLSYAESQGRHLFAQYCSTCHGDEGRGDGQNASNLEPAPPDLTVPTSVRETAFLTTVISQGSAAVGRSPLSPPWGRSLTHQQIEYLVAYCQSLGRNKPA
jgi:mono/diheme cytochrome c family protein